MATRFLQACRNGSVEQMRSLLSGVNQPDVSYCDAEGNTPLHHAVRCDQKEVATVLLEHCSDPYRKNAQGQWSGRNLHFQQRQAPNQSIESSLSSSPQLDF